MKPFRKLTLFTVMFIMVLTISGCAFSDGFGVLNESYELEDSMIESRTLLRRANVGVNVEYKEDGRFFDRTGESQGSGVVFLKSDTYYYALTNFHVVDPEDYDEVIVDVVPSMVEEEIPSEIVAIDGRRDLAILRFEIGDYDLGVIEIVENIQMENSEMVLAVDTDYVLAVFQRPKMGVNSARG